MDNELDEIKQELAKLKETADGLSRLIRELTDSAPQGFAPADLLENAQEGFIGDLTTYGLIDVIKKEGK